MADKPLILVTRRMPEAVEDRLRRDYRTDYNAEDRLWDGAEIIARAEGADAILACPTESFTADVIARLPKSVRAITAFAVGVDNIDLDAAKDHGLIVTNTPDVLTNAVAEITMLLILGAARRASEGERTVRDATWGAWSMTFLLGPEITGQRLGIYGMGRIGRATARAARGFAMTIHYHNRHRLAAELEDGATYHETLEDLLPHSDVLALTAPATAETRHVLNAARIALLPDGAVVVNSARGSLVDDEALIAALRSGKLAAAGLDVFNDEPDIHPAYRELDNAFLLPHLGSATFEARNGMGFRALDNLDAIFAGAEPRDRVV